MRAHLALYTAPLPGGTLVRDITSIARGTVITSGEHGDESLRTSLELSFSEAMRLYDKASALYVRAAFGALAIWEGRLEDPELWVNQEGAGLGINAFGEWRWLTDVPYTALWSASGVQTWRQMNELDKANRTPAKYQANNSGQLYLATQKGVVFSSGADVGSWLYQNLSGSTRQIVGLSLDYTLNIPTNWLFQYVTWNSDFSAGSGTTVVTGSGAQVSGSINVTFSGCDAIELAIFNNTGANSTPAGETGANFIRITNIRLVTATTNRINTTLGTNIAAGTRTVTPASMTGIYVGQRLTIGGTVSESVVVTAITSTTFTAVFAQAHVSTDTVQAFVIYGDEIVKDLLAATNSANTGQLSSSTGLIQSPGIDLLQQVYEDKYPADIIDELAGLGDTQSPPRRWEAGIGASRRLYFQPQGASGRIWYVHVRAFKIQRSLSGLWNSGYTTYKDASGRTLRTPIAADSLSITKAGITRRFALSSDTISSTEAGKFRDTALNDRKKPLPRAEIEFEFLYDALGGRRSLAEIGAGDTLVLQNLPPTVGTAIDRIRRFRIGHTELNLDTNELRLEPEGALPTLDVILAQRSLSQ